VRVCLRSALAYRSSEISSSHLRSGKARGLSNPVLHYHPQLTQTPNVVPKFGSSKCTANESSSYFELLQSCFCVVSEERTRRGIDLFDPHYGVYRGQFINDKMLHCNLVRAEDSSTRSPFQNRKSDVPWTT